MIKQLVLPLLALALGCKKNKSNDGPAPQVSVGDLTAAEGNGGQSTFAVPVTLSAASSRTVTVRYLTVEGTAKAGEDFTAVADGTLTFAPGETAKTVTILVKADDFREGEEQFSLQIASATEATLGRLLATVTITNDDTRVPVAATGYEAPATYAGYTLAWSDEFNGPNLDQTKWSHQNGDGCPALCGWGNNELETYTDRPENLFFQDGKLIIEARKESLNGRAYTSSKILTSGKKSFRFGRIDVRAQLPKGRGIWPAFWLLPQDNVFGGWPRSGEIDLMEHVGHEASKVYGTLHFGPGPGSTQISRSYTLSSGSFNDAFHVFSVEWQQDLLKFYVDNQLYSTVNRSDLGSATYPFNESFYLIINLAVGGNWPGNPDATTSFPQWLVVDYVRVFQ